MLARHNHLCEAKDELHDVRLAVTHYTNHQSPRCPFCALPNINRNVLDEIYKTIGTEWIVSKIEPLEKNYRLLHFTFLLHVSKMKVKG